MPWTTIRGRLWRTRHENMGRIGEIVWCAQRSIRFLTIYLVDPASIICLFQRLSHASLSVSKNHLWNCEWLIKSVIIYLIQTTTWITVVSLELIHAQRLRPHLLDTSQQMVNHNNSRIVWPRAGDVSFKYLPYLSRFQCIELICFWRVRRVWARSRRRSLRDGYYIQGRQQARKLPNPNSGR